MGTINGNQFISSYLGDQIDALLAAMAQANPLPSGTNWVAFIDDCRAAQSAAEDAQAAAESAESGAASSASTASTQATQATIRANAAQSSATLSQSWAVGGTGTRTGENTNNAKYWSQQAQHAAGGGVTSFNNRSGVVLPQSGDYTPDMVGAVPVDGKGINLLDNWYFVGGGSQQGGEQFPINQRLVTTLTNSGYFIDRWKKTTGTTATVNLDSGGLYSSSASGAFLRQAYQNKSDLVGKTLTYSILYKNAGLTSITHVLEADGRFAVITATGAAAYSSTGVSLTNEVCGFYAPTGTERIVAVKLELGDTQTLARQVNGAWVLNDVPPDFATELYKCQTSVADPADTYANNIALMVKKDSTYPDCNYRMNGSVQEWLNPPLVEGVEYRTTERWQGAIVYQQAFEWTSGLTTGSQQIALNITNINMVLSASGYADIINNNNKNFVLTFPYSFDDAFATGIYKQPASQPRFAYKTSSAIVSINKIVIVVKYTKS